MYPNINANSDVAVDRVIAALPRFHCQLKAKV